MDFAPVITLISDFGLDDWYVAAMKAVLLAGCPEARLLDVTHDIAPGDILAGAIALERMISASRRMAREPGDRAADGLLGPAAEERVGGTVHLAVIDPGVGTGRRILVARLAGQWVVCPDNGLITWAWRRIGGGRAYELTWRPATASSTFHGRDIMAPAAAMLASGAAIESIGRPIDDPQLLNVAPAKSLADGVIIHFDRFGNAMTNIPAEMAAGGGEVGVAGRPVGPVRRTYSDVAPGEPLALIGSSEMLEIAVRDGSAKERLGLSLRVSVGMAECRNDAVQKGSGSEVQCSAAKSEIRSQNGESNPKSDPLPQSTQRGRELRRLDKRFVWHPFTPMKLWNGCDPLVIVAAEGMELIDSEGNRYLDGVSSLWCNVHGHRVPEIDAAIQRQLGKVAHSTMLGLASEPGILLAERLMGIAPRSLAKVFYSDSGATATEVAFKLAAQYWYNVGRPEKCEFVGLSDAYHGDTVGAMSVGRVPAFHRPYFPLLFKTHFAPTPFVYHSDSPADPAGVRDACLAAMEKILVEHHVRIAAVVVEPIVQGAAGMIVHPEGYLAGVSALARKYDVLLIADEVATGFGRTGRMFACEHESVEPDLMCLAKGITGGYLPLAATLASQRIFDAFLGEPWEGRTFYHGHTYTGNPLACAAALASLELYERNGLVASVREKSTSLAGLLDGLRSLPHVGDIRQKGLMVGVELVADKATRTPFDPRRRIGADICQKIRRRGVILRPLGDVVVLMPPLAMGVGDLRRIISAAEAELSDIR